MNIAPFLMISGIILFVSGVIWYFSSSFLPLGKLPGDIAIEKENFKFYFPLGTSIVMSILLSGLWWIIHYFR